VVPWLRQRLASFEDASLQGMAGKKIINWHHGTCELTIFMKVALQAAQWPLSLVLHRILGPIAVKKILFEAGYCIELYPQFENLLIVQLVFEMMDAFRDVRYGELVAHLACALLGSPAGFAAGWMSLYGSNRTTSRNKMDNITTSQKILKHAKRI
jgi:hypothetical protein